MLDCLNLVLGNTEFLIVIQQFEEQEIMFKGFHADEIERYL